VRRRTAAAFVVRRHCDTSEPARQRTAEAPLGAAAPTSAQGFLSSNGHASSAAAWRRLKAFSQHGAWSRRPSRRKLAESSYRLRRHPRCLVLGAATDRTPPLGAGASGASTKDKPANDRPSPHSVLVHTSTHFPAAPGRKDSSCRSGGRRLAPGGGRRRQGASSIQSQRICLMLPKHMTALRQGVAPRAPEVVLDDAIQAHLGRLRLRRL